MPWRFSGPPLWWYGAAGSAAGPTQTITVGQGPDDSGVGAPTITTSVTIAIGQGPDDSGVGAPTVYYYTAITLGSAVNEPIVPGITITQPGAASPDTRITVEVLDPTMATVIAALDESWGRTWQEILSDTGVGTVNLQNDDPDLAAVAYRRILRFALDGTACFAAVIERIAKQAVALGEEADETTEVSGRGTLAMLDRGIVYPVGGVTNIGLQQGDRLFNFASPDFDDTGWANAGLMARADVNSPYWNMPNGQEAPAGWPDPSAYRIWPVGASDSIAEIGTCYFRQDFTTATDLEVAVFATADNFFRIYLDGVPIIADEANPSCWQNTYRVHLSLPAGTHTIAARVQNAADYAVGNPAFLMVAVIDEPVEGGTLGTVRCRTDANWKCLAYPDPLPGWTPGAILLTLLGEAQARGSLTAVTPDFTATTDTDGNAWPVIAEWGASVGATLLDVVRSLAETYIDVAMAPGSLTLRAWNIGERGATKAVTFDAAVNVTELIHTGVG